MSFPFRRAVLFTFLLVLAGGSAWAGEEKVIEQKGVTPLDDFPYVRKAMELEVGAGAFATINTRGSRTRPDTGFALGEVRLGWMLSDVMGSGLLRGNVELLGQAYGAGIFDGPGEYLAGAGLLLRWNFVQPQARVVPFIQIEGGGVYSDAADQDAVQRLIGSDLSFSLGGEVGLRFMVNKHFAITGGVEYRHISNANTASRNVGLNALGGTIGLSLFY